jgi:hypothetical protein
MLILGGLLLVKKLSYKALAFSSEGICSSLGLGFQNSALSIRNLGSETLTKTLLTIIVVFSPIITFLLIRFLKLPGFIPSAIHQSFSNSSTLQSFDISTGIS